MFGNLFHEINVNCLIQYFAVNITYHQLTKDEQSMYSQYNILVRDNTGGSMYCLKHCLLLLTVNGLQFQLLCTQIHT